MAKRNSKPTVSKKPVPSKNKKPVKKVVRKRAPKKAEQDYIRDFEYICLEIEKGKPLRRVCHVFMSADKFHSLCSENPALNERYARACEIRADNIFEDMINIADDNSKDVFFDHNGIERTDSDVIQRSRLMVDTRKWVLSKMAPKRYGDKLDLTSDGEKIQSQVTIFQLPDNGRSN